MVIVIWNASRKVNELFEQLSKSKIIHFNVRFSSVMRKLKPLFMMNIKITKD